VDVFYPFQYTRFFDHAWDLVLIEGWFPSIDNFIQMARINNKDAVVLFFLLDPRYPGIDVFLKLKIDGALSNSLSLTQSLRTVLPTKFVMLAADPMKMQPLDRPNRTHGAVFIGAGGLMVVYKYSLMALLRGAASQGLLLYGSHWDEIAEFRGHWKGILPRDEISTAYSSAHVVLSSTIDAQRDAGMINNRVFEALSCGAVVVSEPSQPIEELFGNIVQYVREEQDVTRLIEKVASDDIHGSFYWNDIRRAARSAIVSAHTWDHRVVQIVDFAYTIMLNRDVDLQQLALDPPKVAALIAASPDLFRISDVIPLRGCATQRSLPSLAWVVSDDALQMRDYSALAPQLASILKEFYCIYYFEEGSWLQLSHHYGANFTSAFDVVLVYATMFDSLDVHLASIGRPVENAFDRIPRRIGYLMGVSGPKVYHELRHYDVIWYRDSYDLKELQSQGLFFPLTRYQHVFGLSPRIGRVGMQEESQVFSSVRRGPEAQHDIVEEVSIEKRFFCPQEAVDIVVICPVEHVEACSHENIEINIGSKPFTLVLLGGTWTQWLKNEALFKKSLQGDDGLGAVSLLACTFHFEQGIGNAVWLIANAKRLLYVHNPSISKANEIWPFIAAGNAGVIVEILILDPRVVHVVQEFTSPWPDTYLRDCVLRGIARLHGFAPRSGKVEIEEGLLGGVLFSHPLLFKPILSNITIAQDGRVCFKQNGITSTCILWDLDVWLLSWNFTDPLIPRLSASTTDCNETSLSYKLESECPHVAAYGGRRDLNEIVFEIDIQGPVFSDPSDPLEWHIFVPSEASYECMVNDKLMMNTQMNIIVQV
jgi:hypothetical protein